MIDLEVQILGMSRSGNHAIANWVFAQARGRKLALNCAEGKTNPFLTCRPLRDGESWRAEPALDLGAERRGLHSPKDLLIHTYEDSWPGHAFSHELEAAHDDWLGPSRRVVRLLVLRDPFNLFASRLKMGAALSPALARRMWKSHARLALGRSSRAAGAVRVVLYNRWVADAAYRRALAGDLGVPFCDAGLDEVADCAGGSSFDGISFDGRAREMDTAQRWRRFAGDADYLALFDGQLLDMAWRLFGMAPLAAPAGARGAGEARLASAETRPPSPAPVV